MTKLTKIYTHGGNTGSYVYYLTKLPVPVVYKHHNTGIEKTYENVLVFFRNDDNKPWIVHHIEVLDATEWHKLGFELEGIETLVHPNVNYFERRAIHHSSAYTYISTTQGGKHIAKVYATGFCNPIFGRALYQNPKDNLVFLAMQLGEHNFGSPLNSSYRYYVDFFMEDKRLACRGCGSNIDPVKNDDILGNITGYCASCFNRSKDSIISQTISQIASNPDFVYYKLKHNSIYTYSSKKNFELAYKNNEISDYYPTITRTMMETVLGDIPRQKIDVCVMGLGSAGSGLLDQIGRTNMFETYALIDFDKVENKNIRNQLYTNRHGGYDKVTAMASILQEYATQEKKMDIKQYADYFQNVGAFKFSDIKYIMFGFDSIEVRLEALEKVEKGEITAEYILDTRYDDLTASVFFVKISDPDQMKHYREGLESDLEVFNQIKAEREADRPTYLAIDPDSAEFKAMFASDNGRYNMPVRDCHKVCNEVLGKKGMNFCGLCEQTDWAEEHGGCSKAWKVKCKYEFARYLSAKRIEVTGLNNRPPVEEVTCVSWNIIDVYKYASTYLTAGIREIESKKEKPFTHLQVTTNGLPCSLVMKS